MRKLLGYLLIFSLLLSLMGCNRAEVPETAPSQQSTELPTAQTDPPEPSTEDRTAPTGGLKISELGQSLGLTPENYPRIDGSTSTLSISQQIWAAMVSYDPYYFYAGFPQKASKTVPSYALLIGGEVDLIFVPYASEEVLQSAAEAGVELEFHKVAAEALVFITPKENTAQNITREQIRSIYLDYGITNWSALGGPDRELVPICRNDDSGSQSQMDNLVLNNEPMHPEIQNNFIELTMEGMLEQVAFYHNGGMSAEPTNSYAIGYTLYSYFFNMMNVSEAPHYLKLLDYEGITPTGQSILSEEYPLADGYYAVIRSDLPEDHPARAIITWLQTDEGCELIESANLLSLREAQ